MTHNIQRIMVFREKSFVRLLYNSAHICEGATFPKEPESFCHQLMPP